MDEGLPLEARTPCGRRTSPCSVHTRKYRTSPYSVHTRSTGVPLAAKTPCSSRLLEQKDSLLTKESSAIKTPPNSGISSNNPPKSKIR
ncbi:UNVERIFIED_CONTAM: hypothetical protein Slati_0083000 [Sesamum latifolium]|uniref:Uncharacterized protein n=1 Tax=Sesamum latifolium TaxID=2727402 RepID=A0AAW2Y8D2_9LAMI